METPIGSNKFQKILLFRSKSYFFFKNLLFQKGTFFVLKSYFFIQKVTFFSSRKLLPCSKNYFSKSYFLVKKLLFRKLLFVKKYFFVRKVTFSKGLRLSLIGDPSPFRFWVIKNPFFTIITKLNSEYR